METEAPQANTDVTEPSQEGVDVHVNSDIVKQNVDEADIRSSSVVLQEEGQQNILTETATEKYAESGDVIDGERSCDKNALCEADDHNRALKVVGDLDEDAGFMHVVPHTAGDTALGSRELEGDSRQCNNENDSGDSKRGYILHDTLNGGNKGEVTMENSECKDIDKIDEETLRTLDKTATLFEDTEMDTSNKQLESRSEISSGRVNGPSESVATQDSAESVDTPIGDSLPGSTEAGTKILDGSSDALPDTAEAGTKILDQSPTALPVTAEAGTKILDRSPTALPVTAEAGTKTLDGSSNPEMKTISGDCLEKANEAVSDMEPVICKSDTSTISTLSEGQGSDKPIKVKCLKCSKVMKDKRLIENHVCQSEAEEEKVKITIMLDKNKQGFVCKECDYTSAGHSFEEHLMCHLMVRPYQCLYCKECFINRKDISRHVVKTHNGAKMSCALRALKKAKALIKEATSSGVISFMARVAGKVPLEKDPDKKKQEDSNKTGQNIRESNSSDKKVKESNVTCQGSPDQHCQNAIKDSETTQNKPQSGGTDSGSNQSGQASDNEVKAGTSQSCKSPNVSEKKLNGNKLNKLNEALTSDSSVPVSKISSNDEEPGATTEHSSNLHTAETESGLKIVASFSLQDMGHDECETEQGNSVIQPNFIMSPPVEKEQEMQILSFLGPDRPVFKSSDNICTPMLPPPPLQQAPFHPPLSTNQAAGSGLKQAVKNSNFFVCGFNCLFSSLSTSDFLEHTVNFHSVETYFPCFYCGHRSPNEADLVRHISNHTHTHSSSSLYVCGNSGCRFGTNMVVDYITHIKTTHSDALELECHSCGDTFLESCMLLTHVEDNVIHIVNCPHCSSKATDRKTILTHISSAHPGKPKMVSVAKQLICHDRKVNNYEQMVRLRDMLPPALTPAPFASGKSVIDQVLSSHELAGEKFSGISAHQKSDVSISVSSPSPRDAQLSASGESPLDRPKEATPDSGKSPASESSDFDSMKVKEEVNEDAEEYGDCPAGEDSRSAYVVDENGVRRRIYVPMSERKAENYRCKHCTFIARDSKRMHCHERSHGMPPTRKERFKCMFCPQGFDSELKFRLHITCHPGLIKFLLYRCKKCEFDTNQKHIIIRHITCNRDRKHRGFGPLEEQYSVVSRSLESRVLECERCDYMTRHKIHMTIHYQRKHNILKDKGDFTIENLMPTDTPVASPAASTDASPSTSFYKNFNSPGSYHDDSFDFTKPSPSVKNSKSKSSSDSPVFTPTQITERNELFNRMVSQQAALQPGHVMENQMRKFKCPICKYLLPKAADLKNHVKRHSEVGQITLVMFRCKYCSCMSTARELLYEHLMDKHPGKPIALVKKIVIIDTTDVDKSFAETAVEESLDQLEESLQKEMMSALNSGSSVSTNGLSSYEQIFVLPEAEDTFTVSLQCPRCSYSSDIKSDIVDHINTLHPEVRVIGSDEDVDNLARATSEDLQQASKPDRHSIDSQEEVLILPDDQVFNEPTLCSRCDFATMFRQEMVVHLQQNHPEISVMGHSSYPVQASAIEQQPVEPVDESCVVGSGSLDAKVRCLYENYGTQMKCLICGAERPKKFFIHVHILRHLNIYLWKCTFCAHRGLQKYKMIDHIKKIHPGKPLSVRYLKVNVEEKVTQFLSQFSVIKNRKASLDEGNYVPFTSDELSDQASSDSSRSRQKSPGPGNDNSCAHSLGSDELDAKISCMYEDHNGVHFKCRVCPYQFQRKFAMHRHIIISHLKVALLSCAYCGMEGVERHQLVDHILTCHKPAPISILTLDIDLHKMASDVLAKMASKAQNGSFDMGYAGISEGSSLPFSSSNVGEEEGCNQGFSHNPNSMLKFGPLKYGKSMKPATFRFGNKVAGAAGVKSNRKVDPDVVMLGRLALDQKLSCLYQECPSGQLRCLVCRWEFPRKYPLHRHIMLRHLKLSLVGCPYCPFEGIEKYNVTTHVREEHKDKPISIKFTQPDVETRVRQFVDNMANIGGTSHEDLIQKPQRKRRLMQVKPKIEKSSDDEMGNDDDDEDEEEEEDNEGSQKTHHSGLVVAMFGKKKPSNDKDIVVKTEIDDEQMEEGSALQTNDDAFNDYKRDEESGSIKNSFEPLLSNSSPFKHSVGASYTPGFYRSPAGGKAKALDVITKIKVLKSKEGPIMKFYCEKCKFTSLHRSNIVRHIYKIHEKYQTHTCPMCNYQTLSPMLMERHLEKAHHSGQAKDDSLTKSPFSKFFVGLPSIKKKKKSTPIKHIKQPEIKTDADSYTGPKQYACAYCYYETNTQADILQHTRDNHSQGDSNAAETKASPSLENSTVKSEEASSACWDGSKKAVKRKWQDEEEGVYKRKRRFIFEKGNELIQCGHCETKETSMSRMQDHITWDHPGLPFQAKQIPAWRFLCKSCSVKTMATSKMKYHLNRHINYRPYTCVTCGAFFPSPDQCRRHSRSQAHEEQYTYVRNPKKESKVEELLEATRQLALKVQEEAATNPDFDMSQADNFISKYQESRSNLKKNPHGILAKDAKKAAADADQSSKGEGAGVKQKTPKKQQGKSPQSLNTEQETTIKCYYCEFTSGNVSGVNIHHKEAHPSLKFLWTEIERGFTCDSTGEALVDCDSVPGASMDVGYTTRMTLGAGSNTMRFKCKTCDFSSFVIQAMKSHLKSHQPKGFICPYCSRSFSGKEKLMRHQYCLHKGQPLWVIHLRRSGVTGATSVKKGKAGAEEDSGATVKEETTPEEDGNTEDADSSEKLVKTSQAATTTYFCNECSFSSESLYHFRRHLAQQHQESKRKAQDNSVAESPLQCSYCPFLAETEADFGSHAETHSSSSHFQCGHCDYTASERSSVEQHLASDHSYLEPKISEIGPRGNKNSHDRKDLPSLPSLKPSVTIERIPDSVLTQYGYQSSEEADMTSDDEDDREGSAVVSADEGTQQQGLFEDPQSENSTDDRLMATEEHSTLGVVENEDSSNSSRLMATEKDSTLGVVLDEDSNNSSRLMATEEHSTLGVVLNEDSNNSSSSINSVQEDDIEENLVSDNFDSNLNALTDSDELARELGLVEDETSCVLGSDADMMIMQFGGLVDDKDSDLPQESIPNDIVGNNDTDRDDSVAIPSPNIQGSSSVFCSKDSTLFAAQENNDDEEDDGVVTFDSDIMLTSPLPMISLGDGVSMSPMTVESKVDSNVDSLIIDNQLVAMDVDSASEVLLNI